jgi:polysaccharide export outer membrane protein
MLVAGFFIAGCKSGTEGVAFAQLPGDAGASSAQGGTISNTSPARPLGNDTMDAIRTGDTLRINFSDLPIIVQSPIEERVKDDGTITLLESQTFTAAGKTRGQLEKEIHDRYVPDYYKKMTVSVLPKSDTQFYFVDGEVKMANRQVYLSRTTVLKAIASAGGFTDFANKGNVTLTRVDGRTVKVNCKKAQKDPRLDLEVFPGDKIWVPRRIF